jgi:hypothetical protein
LKKSRQPCPVCPRTVNCLTPRKGDLAWEETYCSKYCRLYDEKGLKMVPFDGDCVHHNGKLRWPRIPIECDMCGTETLLLHDVEKANRAYCSTKCWNNLKSCQKRGIHRTMNMLHFLEHRKKYDRNGWVSPSSISERCGRKGQMCSPTTVGLSLKRWREAGIVEAKLIGGSQHGHEYRFILKGLKGMTVSRFVHNWNTMSYAERMAFQQT